MAADSSENNRDKFNTPSCSKDSDINVEECPQKIHQNIYFEPSAFQRLADAPRKKYNSSEEYFVELREWLQQVFFWQSVSSAFPYFLMHQQVGQPIPNQTVFTNERQTSPTNQSETAAQSDTIGSRLPSGNQSNGNIINCPQFPRPPFNLNQTAVPFPFYPQFRIQNEQPQQSSVHRPTVIDGIEVRIPAFWKRVIAEFIDFLILFFVKIVVTYFAVDFFHIIDLDNFDVFQKDMKIAYKAVLQITQDIVMLELVHRIFVCAFETFWLQGGHDGRVGGSTPGKSIMGLRVVRCDSVTLREGEEMVVVKPGTNLGLACSFMRAAIKNLVLALLIPTSFAFIFFPHNRTGYDMICNTIVIEEPIIPHRVHQD